MVRDLNPWPSGCDNYAQQISSIFSNIFQRWPANHPLLFLITERCVSWAMVQIWHTNVIVFILTYPTNTTLCFYVSERKISLFSLTNSCSIFPSVARGGSIPNDILAKHPHGRGEDEPYLYGIILIWETPPRAWGRLYRIRVLGWSIFSFLLPSQVVYFYITKHMWPHTGNRGTKDPQFPPFYRNRKKDEMRESVAKLQTDP